MIEHNPPIAFDFNTYYLPRHLEVGDKVKLKNDAHWGVVSLINGMRTAFDLTFPLGIKYNAGIQQFIGETLKPNAIEDFDKL